ncbi:uncharacterized protein VTP21DRAFT_10831 [Calcarisporiella thermophila]|uniref:uncharacterized protein n=1 Tax=Calcarisporiella thermophila TaxID=911321 RepID=UPI00374388C2
MIRIIALLVLFTNISAAPSAEKLGRISIATVDNLDPAEKQVSSLLLHQKINAQSALNACQHWNETVYPLDKIDTAARQIFKDRAYREYKPFINSPYWVQTASDSNKQTCNALDLSKFKLVQMPCSQELPVLCTNTQDVKVKELDKAGVPPPASSYVEIDITVGRVKGYRDLDSFRFLGVPYAQPPVGELRFEPTLPLERHNETIDATEAGPWCLQRKYSFIPARRESEDCLTLNVYTSYLPQEVKEDLRPVLFWIYGGSFSIGASSDPAFDGAVYASREDLVVVTFNYRLDYLGFLTMSKDSQGKELKGNQAVHDALLALKWTHDNIAKFGGDPSRITVAGESAGGIMADALMMVPEAKQYFNKSILISNTPGDKFYRSPEVYQHISQAVAKAVNCTNDIACLKRADANQIIAASQYNGVPFPTVDSFVTKEFTEVESVDIPLVFGFDKNEAEVLLQFMSAKVDTPQEYIAYLKIFINETYIPQILSSKLYGETYGPNNTQRWPQNTAANSMATLIGHRLLHCPMLRLAKRFAKQSPVYMFAFEKGYNEYYDVVQGHSDLCMEPGKTCHQTELPYFFGSVRRPEFRTRNPDYAFARRVVARFGQFMREGNMAVKGLEPAWDALKPGQAADVYVFGEEDKIRPDYGLQEICAFWDSLLGDAL